LNERAGADAIATSLDEIVCVVSATEAHSQANMRRSRADAVALVRHVASLAKAAPHRPIVNVGLAMSFGCSIAGDVRHDDVVALAESCLEAGADIIGIADTVGYAGPNQVGALSARIAKLCGSRPFIVHLHDTRGLGIANAAAALDNGARVLDGALGGLGGCPFAPGASGNIVFEDLVFLAESKGFATGIDIAALKGVRAIAEAAMPGEPFTGGISRAGLPPLQQWRSHGANNRGSDAGRVPQQAQ
jgi:hydroxymethylglutaryl-CoA lyase